MTTTLHKIEIRQRPESAGKPMTGANVLLALDGKPLLGCSQVKFEVKAGNVAKITLTMVAEVVLTAEIGSLTKRVKKLTTL